MSQSSGLQRRRAPGASDVQNAARDEEEDVPRERGVSGERSTAVLERTSGSGSVAALDTRSGRRFAYDPRDLSDENEMRTHPRLTLMEELLLLGLKDKQGYLSFWNDNISYTLRGCLLLELAFRGRITVAPGADQKRLEVCDRCVEVRSTKTTGEPLLDETLRVMKSSPSASIIQWIDMLSGETWNLTKLNLQLKQVRERLAKGLVDKGVLRTEKRNFLIFDMPTHPIADTSCKDALRRRLYAILLSKSPSVHPDTFYKEEASNIGLRVTRSLCMVCAAECASVLENTLTHVPYDTRELALQHASHLLDEFGQWPMAPDTPCGGIPPRGSVDALIARPVSAKAAKKKTLPRIGASSAELARAMRAEYDAGSAPAFEVIAGVLHVFNHMEGLL